MKGRSKGRALERRPFEKSCSKKDAQKKAVHVRDVSWEQSARRNRGRLALVWRSSHLRLRGRRGRD